MSVDMLQEKIRKLKNPSVLELGIPDSDIPDTIRETADSPALALGMYCEELLSCMKGLIPAVRVSFSAFALLGADGIRQLQKTLLLANSLGYYVLMDAPEIYSPSAAQYTANTLLGDNSAYFCDGLVISGYLGSDVIKPFLPYCKKGKKDIFVVTRTANKSAPELQDLLAGSRLVHAAAADYVNRHGAGTVGKFGYASAGILAAATSAESLRGLRSKYPSVFLLLDGYDYPNGNAKNCSFAFDKFGHGAVACAGSSITAAWKNGDSEAGNYLEKAVAAAERMKKNLTRYVTIM